MNIKKNEKPRIWLCDLTYTQQTIASDIMPAGVGCIATYAEKFISTPIETKIFKTPENFIEAIEAGYESGQTPQIIGFSNYIWNRDLSSNFAKVIKKKLPNVITVFGGPNYPTQLDEQEAFCRAHKMVDFFIIGEGEIAFAKLAEALIANDFKVGEIFKNLPSLHYVQPNGTFYRSELVERIWDLSEIPSPYLKGKMDEFFDGKFLPIIQTKRGCPFKCTFCVEGNSYYSRVAKSDLDKTDKEVRFICEKMGKLLESVQGRTDMHISDSNFGMFKDDLQTCGTIAEMQEKFSYPEYVNVATGKNHKKRVLEAAKMINGTLRLSGAVQSLDKDVLENIQRHNIDENELLDLAQEANGIGANSYSEIILGLPGDSLKAHFSTIRKVVEADFNNLCLYQLMLLPGTDLASEQSKKKWEMKTRFRALPRCYGYFDFMGEEINAAEIEEICIANNSMSYDDYLESRKFHLIANVFYNDAVFKEVLRLLSVLGLSKFEWLQRIFEYRLNEEFNTFVDEFAADTRNELWEDYNEAADFIRQREHLKKYVESEFGSNLLFKYRSIALVNYVPVISDVATKTIASYLTDTDNEKAFTLARELIDFSKLRMGNIFCNFDSVYSQQFNFAVDKFANDVQLNAIGDYTLDEPKEIFFELTEKQVNAIKGFIEVYGDNCDGYSRIIAKVYMRRLFRIPTENRKSIEMLSRKEAVKGDSQLSGLNEFV